MIGEILASLPLLFAAAIGLVIALIAAALLWDQHQWTLKAKKVTGVVVGARTEQGSKGQVYYYPVYEFTDLAGQLVRETQHSVGSSSPSSVKLGRRVPVYLHPDKPGEVRDGNKIQFIVAFILLLVGGGVFYFSLSKMKVSPGMIAAVPLMIAVLLFKMRGSLRETPLTKSQFRATTEERRAKKRDSWEARPMLGERELREAQAAQDRVTGWIAPIFLIVGVGLILGGMKQGGTMTELMAKGVHASGTVIELEESHGSDSTTYKPVVRYRSREGEDRVFKSSFSSSPPMYSVGETVGVLYLESAPHKEIIDHGMLNWGLTGILYGAGALTILFSGKAWSNARRRRERL